MRKHTSPHDRHLSPLLYGHNKPQRRVNIIPYAPCGTVRTENVLLHCPKIIPYLKALVKSFLNFFQKSCKSENFKAQNTLFEHLSPSCEKEFNNDICALSKMHNYLRHESQKILNHGFSNEKFYKKSSKMDIYKSKFMRYNISAVGGTNTTASRTTVIVFGKVSSL
jgi:hypothetical protein